MQYEIKPIESLTTKTGVRELCAMLATGQISQRAAQAAAWNLNNNMSWEQLISKQYRFANGTTKPYFTRRGFGRRHAVVKHCCQVCGRKATRSEHGQQHVLEHEQQCGRIDKPKLGQRYFARCVLCFANIAGNRIAGQAGPKLCNQCRAGRDRHFKMGGPGYAIELVQIIRNTRKSTNRWHSSISTSARSLTSRSKTVGSARARQRQPIG